MPRPDDGVVGKAEEHVTDRSQQDIEIAARKVGSPDRPREERVANDEHLPLLRLLPFLSFFPYRETHPSGAMSRRVPHANLVAPEGQRTFSIVEMIDGRLPLDGDAEH